MFVTFIIIIITPLLNLSRYSCLYLGSCIQEFLGKRKFLFLHTVLTQCGNVTNNLSKNLLHELAIGTQFSYELFSISRNIFQITVKFLFFHTVPFFRENVLHFGLDQKSFQTSRDIFTKF